MQFKESFSTIERIELLQMWILTNSVLYYNYDMNIVDDATFDNNMRQLVGMMKLLEASQTKYYYVFADYDVGGSVFLFNKCSEELKLKVVQRCGYLMSVGIAKR